jgi:hypothetical protein
LHFFEVDLSAGGIRGFYSEVSLPSARVSGCPEFNEGSLTLLGMLLRRKCTPLQFLRPWILPTLRFAAECTPETPDHEAPFRQCAQRGKLWDNPQSVSRCVCSPAGKRLRVSPTLYNRGFVQVYDALESRAFERQKGGRPATKFLGIRLFGPCGGHEGRCIRACPPPTT